MSEFNRQENQNEDMNVRGGGGSDSSGTREDMAGADVGDDLEGRRRSGGIR